MSDAAASAPAFPTAPDTSGLTLDDIARLTGGRVVDAGARPEARVRRVAPLADASDDSLAFYADARYRDDFADARAAAVLITPALAESAGAAGVARIVVDRPHEAMLAVVPSLYPVPARPAGVHATARLGRGVRLGAGVTIDAYASVGDDVAIEDDAWIGAHCALGDGVRVGRGSALRAHVTLYDRTVLGARVTIHSGVRLGSDGFGYVFASGAHQKIPHVGRCVIEDDVEIGANTTVDRGSVGDTVIGAGTKIDNLVHIGHNVRIGRRCLVMAQVGIAGSATIGDGVILAGQVGVGGHVTIGSRARIAGQAGVFGDVPDGETWGGYPARPHKESLRAQAALFRLVGLLRPLERLIAADRGDAA